MRLRRSPDDGTAGGGAPADPELEAWRAEEAAREGKAKAARDAAAAAATPKPPPQDAPPAEPSDMHRQLAAGGVWGLDYFAVRWLGPHYRLDASERAELERLATPVVAKWLPDLEGELTPEQALLAGVVFIYGTKWIQGPPKAKAEDVPTGAGPAPQDRAGGPPRLEVMDAQVKHG